MYRYVTVAEMQAIEREANAKGITYDQMMENAGIALGEAVEIAYSQCISRDVLGLVGSGNNGGDTLVALSYLANKGWSTKAYLVRTRAADDPLLKRFIDSGGQVFVIDEDDGYARLLKCLGSVDIILDGIFGTGLKLPLRGQPVEVLAVTRDILKNLGDLPKVVAVDCPSGVDCDSGAAADEVLTAQMTVTMAAVKQGLLKLPAFQFVGNIRCVDIGLPDYLPALKTISRFVTDLEWVRSALPKRPMDAHKGTFGTALLAAGSLNYTGAALLAGKAAYLSGAGLVTMAIPQSLHTAIAGQFPEATWLLLPEDNGFISQDAADLLLDNLGRSTAILLGPGFGLEKSTREFVARVIASADKSSGNLGFIPMVSEAKRSAIHLPPFVIDADGLKLMAQIPDWATKIPGVAILTPHPGEMAVLTGLDIADIQSNRLEVAERYARQWGHVVVLKGAFTLVADPDGRTGIIPVASPALARAGSGDVLAGVITGLRAQGMLPFEAALAGAWIHAQAGLAAASVVGTTASVLAGDILANVPDVMRSVIT